MRTLDFISYDELLDHMLDNIEDKEYDRQLRLFSRIAKILKINNPRKLIVLVSDEYAPLNYFNDGAKISDNVTYYDDFATNTVPVVEEILNNNCYAFEIAAFKVREHLKNDKGSFLSKIANYHSRTPDLNKNYQTKLIQHSNIWRNYLKNNKYTVYQWEYSNL